MNLVNRPGLSKIAAAILLGGLASSIIPIYASAKPMPEGPQTNPPPGYTQFCRFNQAQCTQPDLPTSSKPPQFAAEQLEKLAHTHTPFGRNKNEAVAGIGKVSESRKNRAAEGQLAKDLKTGRILSFEEVWERVEYADQFVNSSLQPVTDQAQYGVIERWEMPLTKKLTNAGDCEDYALEKRQLLQELGIPRSSLFFAVGHHRSTSRHAVLVVSTDKGDFILDNMTSDILHWKKSRYKWIKRQSGHRPNLWMNIES